VLWAVWAAASEQLSPELGANELLVLLLTTGPQQGCAEAAASDLAGLLWSAWAAACKQLSPEPGANELLVWLLTTGPQQGCKKCGAWSDIRILCV